MNIVSDPKLVPASSVLSPEANQAAALATASGVLTVDLDALIANWKKLEKTAVPAECAGVIKADAYGCGAEPVARALAGAGCRTFFVATLDEARVVRAAAPSAALYVLDGFFQNTGDAYARVDARPVIGDLYELAEWDVFCRRSGWSGGAAIQIDTGMNRLGLTVAEAQGIIPRINAGDHGITLVMSHLACAESLNHPLNSRQLASFREIAGVFSGVPASLSNSSGIFLGAPFQFDLVRPGAALYGVNPTPEADNPMQAVVELKAIRDPVIAPADSLYLVRGPLQPHPGSHLDDLSDRRVLHRDPDCGGNHRIARGVGDLRRRATKKRGVIPRFSSLAMRSVYSPTAVR